MKKRLLILALCLGTGGISVANPLAAINDDPPPRMEKIGRERTIPLVRDGKTEMEIVIPADAFPIVRFAAEEIQKTLQKASGAEIPGPERSFRQRQDSAFPGRSGGGTRGWD